MIVIKITEEQKDILKNTEFLQDSIFNPIQDKNDNWIISIEEYNACLEYESCIKEHPWIKDCEQIEYEPKDLDITTFK